MTHHKVYTYLFVGFVVLSLIGCSSFQSQAKIAEPILSKQDENKPSQESEPTLEAINWIEAFTISTSQRIDVIEYLTNPTTTKNILLRSIFLTHESATYEELQEAEQLLKSNFISDSSVDLKEAYQLRNYVLTLNQAFQDQKLQMSVFQEQIDSYKRLIKKQKQENNVLENKIEALTDIEHQINLRPDKNPLEVAP